MPKDNPLQSLQEQLRLIQQAYINSGKRAIILLQGPDAAGKGGLIRRIAWAMDPRGFRVWPIRGPNPEELKQHYLQRFWEKLPSSGEVVIFDRSWYGRVLDERVEKLCSREQWMRAFHEINAFEEQLLDEEFRIIKIYLDISKKEQLRRFEERLHAPEKRWKLTYEDFRNREKWGAHQKAVNEMFKRTSTPRAPWYRIPADDKAKSRIEAIAVIIANLKKGVDLRPPPVPERLLKIARANGLKIPSR
jgi:polyphosphate kinase 2 (PPK2 family)